MPLVRIALAGNPNSGKTTMFNELTGSTQYVGNWPGVTVEKKEGKLRGHKEVVVQDLPGIYSLSPYTPEEIVSRTYLLEDQPEAIINLVDGTNLERNLYLTTQLAEVGVPMVLAINMIDVVKKNGIGINTEKLSKILGCAVVEMSALRGVGTREAAQAAVEAANAKATPMNIRFSGEMEERLTQITELISTYVSHKNKRWYAIKVFERDEKVRANLNLPEDIDRQVEAIIDLAEQTADDGSESIIINERYAFVEQVVKQCVKHSSPSDLTTSDGIDQVVTNRWLALPIFVLVMFAVYYLSIATIGAIGTNWVNDTLFGELIPVYLGGFLENLQVAPWLFSLIMDGIVAGVGAVLGFLPQMTVLFICLAFLEDCGYMARIAFILDRIFRRFGLSGKSFIPILVGTGCSVPGVAASRTIENDKDRRMTVIVTSFMPCSAKLPVIALIAGALFSGSWWLAPSAYFVGIAAILLSGIMLKKTKMFAGDVTPFVMELPAYHMPQIKGLFIHTFDRVKAFVIKAGTIIFISSAIIWFLSSFNTSFEMVDTNDSILAIIGGFIAPIFAPLGWGNWQAATATITGLVAKENIVGTFGILFRNLSEVSETGTEIWGDMAGAFTKVGAYSLLIFNLLCVPCLAAIGAIRREMASPKWTAFALLYQMGLAYSVSFMVYQLGSFLFEGASFGLGQVLALLLLAGFIWLLARKTPTQPKKEKLLSRTKAKV